MYESNRPLNSFRVARVQLKVAARDVVQPLKCREYALFIVQAPSNHSPGGVPIRSKVSHSIRFSLARTRVDRWRERCITQSYPAHACFTIVRQIRLRSLAAPRRRNASFWRQRGPRLMTNKKAHAMRGPCVRHRNGARRMHCCKLRLEKSKHPVQLGRPSRGDPSSAICVSTGCHRGRTYRRIQRQAKCSKVDGLKGSL